MLVLDRKAARIEPLVDGVDVPVYVAPEPVLRETLGFNLHRGVIASAHRTPLPASRRHCSSGSSCDRGARGAQRSREPRLVLPQRARASGSTPCCSIRRPRIRSIDAASASRWDTCCGCRSRDSTHGPTASTRSRTRGFTVVALTPSSDALSIDEVAASGPDKVAIVLGAEGPGLSDDALARADMCVRIPMASDVDSVNVATAAAIAFHRLVTCVPGHAGRGPLLRWRLRRRMVSLAFATRSRWRRTPRTGRTRRAVRATTAAPRP